MAAKTINVGLIGTKFMGKAHSNAYLKVAKFFDVEPQPVMKAICGRHADETAEFAKRFGWESHETDWQKLCERKDIDVSISRRPAACTTTWRWPRRRRASTCSARSRWRSILKDAREMLDAARKAGVVHMVNFNYRVRAGARAGQADDHGGRDRRGSPLPRDVSAGLARRSEVSR